jgi:acetyl esterase/lipase
MTLLEVLSVLLRPLGWIYAQFAQHLCGDTPVLRRSKRKRLRASVAVQRDINYNPIGMPPLLADVYTPNLAGPLPAVLMIHGGGWISGERSQTARQARQLAARGFVVVNATYRLAPAARFPAQLRDMQQALRWMRSNSAAYSIDPARIGAWGYSAGAQLAALLGSLSAGDSLYAADASVMAVVAGGTPADLRKFRGGTMVPAYLGEKWRADSAVFREASPAATVAAGDAPVFLYHGTWDLLVPLDQTVDYQKALAAAKVPNELYLMRGLGHITAFLMDGEALQRGADFLDRYLRDSDR